MFIRNYLSASKHILICIQALAKNSYITLSVKSRPDKNQGVDRTNSNIAKPDKRKKSHHLEQDD